MKRITLLFAILLIPVVVLGVEGTMDEQKVADQIIDMERQALARWIDGDPTGFLEITSDDYTYFDPGLEKRIDGFEAMKAYYEPAKGKVHADFQKFFRPKVQVFGDTAVLTFQFQSWNEGGAEPDYPMWNTTEVYHRYPDGWKLVHTHWALTKKQE